jgi:acetyl esterase
LELTARVTAALDKERTVDASQWPTLDSELAGIVAVLPDMTGAMDDVVAARQAMVDFMPKGPVPHEDDLDITDVTLRDGVRVRVYRPSGATGYSPGLLYLHGGGFCLGSVELEHGGAVQLAHALRAVVVSVDYRLAPEHPYPAGLDDCYRALLFLADLDIVDKARIGVHGASAGGGLAAAVALLARDRGGPRLVVQSLGMPELDDRLETPSMKAFLDTPLWSRPQAEASWRHYLGGAEPDGYAAPARMADLSGLPPAYVTTMELDPLRDEGITYAMRLLAAGVSVELHSYPGTFHGSALATSAAVSKRQSADLIAALAAKLGGAAPLER